MRCHNCSRFIGHYKEPYFMTLGDIRRSLESLYGFKGQIGIMGGEPTLHPLFEDICLLFQEYIPKSQRSLWTNGFKWKKYENIIQKTFNPKNIVYNDHSYEYHGQHQPLLISSQDIIKDPKLRRKLINKCWVQERWSASINPRGAFFCEVAGALEMLFELGGGWKIEEKWWNKEIHEFEDQIETYCSKCSMAIPFEKEVYENPKQLITKNNLIRLKLNNNRGLERFELYQKEYFRKDYLKNYLDWKPGTFRDFYQVSPDKILTKEEYEVL